MRQFHRRRHRTQLKAPFPRFFLDALSAAGIDVKTTACSAGTTVEALESGVSRTVADAFAVAAIGQVADPGFGLAAGAHLDVDRFGIVGLLAMMQPTLGDALRAIARFDRLIWGDPCTVKEDACTMRLSFVPLMAGRPYNRCKLDAELAGVLAFADRFTRRALDPVGASVSCALADDRRRYEAALRCPVSFGRGEDGIAFRLADLSQRLASANPRMAPVLEAHAEALLSPWLEPERRPENRM